MEIDTSELRALSVDLGSAASKVLPEVRATVKRGLQNIKDDLSAEYAASRHFKALAGSPSYDVDNGGLSGEVGPDKSRGGALANIAHFGGANGGGGTVDLDGVVAAEEPRFMKALDEALGKAL